MLCFDHSKSFAPCGFSTPCHFHYHTEADWLVHIKANEQIVSKIMTNMKEQREQHTYKDMSTPADRRMCTLLCNLGQVIRLFQYPRRNYFCKLSKNNNYPAVSCKVLLRTALSGNSVSLVVRTWAVYCKHELNKLYAKMDFSVFIWQCKIVLFRHQLSNSQLLSV